MKKLFFALMILAAALPLLSQEWEIAVEDYYESSWFRNPIQNKDGDVVYNGLVGDNHETANSCVMKVDQIGNIEFHVFQNDTLLVWLDNIIQIENGNYFISGVYYYRDDSDMKRNPLIMLLDENLNLIMERYIDVCGDTYLNYGEHSEMTMDDDGNVIIIGDIMYDQTWNYNYWGCVLFKYSEDGNEIKRNIILDNEDIKFTSPSRILNVPNSDELLVLGQYQSSQGLLFFDSELNFIRGFGLCTNDFQIIDMYSDIFVDDDKLILYNDGKDLLPYYPYVSDTIYGRVCIVDFQGEPIDCYYIRPSVGRIIMLDNYQLMSAVNEKFYYVLTTEEIYSCGPKYPHIYLMDTDLNVLGYKILSLMDASDYSTTIVSTKDGGCLMGISINDSSLERHTYHILKFPVTEFDPTWSVGETEKADITSDVYPNPATNTLHLNSDEDATLSITDIQGRILLQKNVSGGDNEIDISGLNSGMYIYQINGNDSENKIGKFIKK